MDNELGVADAESDSADANLKTYSIIGSIMAGRTKEQELWGNHGPHPYQPFSTSNIPLGSRLRAIRMGKNLTQVDVAPYLGFGKVGASQLSKVEQNEVPVDREFVDRVVLTFGLDESTHSELLLGGRFLPTGEEIEGINQWFHPEAEQRATPVYLLDFAGRLLSWNQATTDVYGLKPYEKRIQEERPHMLELMFDPSFGLRQKLEPCWEEASRLEVEAFFLDSAKYGLFNYRWHFLLLVRLMRLDGFTSLWHETEDQGYRRLLEMHPILDAERKLSIKSDYEQEKAFSVLHTLPLVFDARLHAAVFVPEKAA